MAPALDDGLMHDGNTGVICPTCGGTTGTADSFCESCGTELAPPVSSADPPGYTAQCPVCSLDESATPGPISAEGYCESCGRKVPSGRDHVELNLELLAGVTDRGLRHPRNEDAMALATTETPAGPVAIAVVCDGVSSSPHPEDASLTGAQAAVRMLLSSIRRGDDPDEASKAAVRQAHEAMTILGSPSRAPSATYVSAIVGPEGVTLCWLGDSRAYWLATESESVRLTRDDSLAEELVAQGQMTEAEAMASPQAHVITRWLGADVVAPEPHVARFEPPGRGVVMVCSDGLWNYQPDAAALAEIALPDAFNDPSSAADALLKFALDAGGMDNITIVLVPFPLVRPAPLPRRSAMTDSGFTIDVDQNQYLPEGGRDVSAVVTVSSGADVAIAAPGGGAGSAEIIIIDCSGSMDYPPTKMSQAKVATAAAIDVVRDGVGFAVVAGTSTAWPVFPPDGSMAVASPSSRAAAKQAVGALRANGGTAIGQWLALARQIFAGYPAQLRHAILLTDGKNQHETPERLAAELSQCEGVVQLRLPRRRHRLGSQGAAHGLDHPARHGGHRARPSGLAADFAAMMENAMGKQVADVSLRVWTPQTATLKFVKQVAPAVEDLTGRRTQTGPQAGDYPTGAWGPGRAGTTTSASRSPRRRRQEMLAARISLVAGTEILGQGLVRAIWTDDEALSTKINPRVAHYTGQAELADAIQEGLEARKQGDEETATARLAGRWPWPTSRATRTPPSCSPRW
jgi:Serine/threonine protein phosphatase